ncbi:hypothetical protein FPQ18DRAFT_122298 [Pyronema domesticum]|nr:hypothetical protein FPQ18DRAFT_122298 [Pyronema domesticum]
MKYNRSWSKILILECLVFCVSGSYHGMTNHCPASLTRFLRHTVTHLLPIDLPRASLSRFPHQIPATHGHAPTPNRPSTSLSGVSLRSLQLTTIADGVV